MEEQTQNPNSSSFRVDRKVIEKNRRIQMKSLCSKLNSLLPHHHPSREVISLPDQLEEAANYIKKLQIKLERMKEKRERLLMGIGTRQLSSNDHDDDDERLTQKLVEIHEIGSAIEVVLITGLDFQSLFRDTIRILHEQGADVINASFSTLNDTVYHTVHAEVGEMKDEGDRVARIIERLENLVYVHNSNNICIK